MADVAQGAPKLRIDLLGDLRWSIAGTEIELAAPMHRAILAILAVNANSVVSTEQIIDEVWGASATDGTRTTLQSYVSVLRRVAREAGRDELIETRSPGYVLRLDEDELDLREFRQLVAIARQTARGGDREAALRAAVALVRGRVLPDLTHLDTVRVLATDVADRWRWLVQEVVEADLAAGRAAECVPLVRSVVDANPLEERMWGLLMRCLYRAGRQADALRAYQELREILVEQLGVDPSPEIRAIERDILDGSIDDVTAAVSPTLQERRTVSAPHPTSSLIGRHEELNLLDDVLDSHRVVSLTGPGGCGKTRLAAETARVRSARTERIVWVELNPLEDDAGVDEAIASAVGAFGRSEDLALDGAVDALNERPTLLIVDNCEHVIDRAALAIEYLLQHCSELTVLATSRERLMVAGEYAVAVPPLASASPLELTRSRFEKPSEAAVMFAERAGLGAMAGDDLGVIEAICAQLDGIPLAIELAAPLVQVMSLDDIADRLLDRFRLLGEEHRTARPQHRTLRAVVEWSHDLLDQDERRTFAALSVFPGSFTMEAAEAVAAAVGEDARVVLPRLVRKSVVLADTSGAVSRHRVLRTLRAFAAEQLAVDTDAAAAAREAFIGHFATQARRWGRHQQTATVTAWLEELGPDTPNFQSAAVLAREGDLDRALLFVDVFQWYFNYIGQLAETRRWLARVADEHDLTLEQRTIALVCQASLANFSGDYGATTDLAENALESARRLGDPGRLNAALIMRGTTATFEGNAARAAECFIESAELSEQLGDQGGMAASMAFWGIAHRRTGNFVEARRCLNEAFEGFSRLHDQRGMALVVGNLGRLAHQEGELDRALELTSHGFDLARQSMDPMVTAQVALFRGHLALDRGELDDAFATMDFALEQALLLGNRTMSSAAMEWMVVIGGAEPRHVAVVDAFTTLRRNAPGTASPRPEWDAAVTHAAGELSADVHAKCTSAGQSMDLDEAIEYARAAAGR
ncbi:MAG: BTAD domain-containing putative transcriptional regulator [Actinomycetota bacterium]